MAGLTEPRGVDFLLEHPAMDQVIGQGVGGKDTLRLRPTQPTPAGMGGSTGFHPLNSWIFPRDMPRI